ncbi:MAG: hypothetical protein A3H57_00775 [Candidatus Taylorbacteria bacterium RIFCSPLOWO2_02_FULL_43_11]|uniref:PsbP C-terminal domain-containing protein n=1 Tax=Candidatus Taylorbacteria bacterium RIFCSPHIGHO2_02_FULL_43_32b TaxID=1802306 RepID=A0A1G2MKV5_9BACT|nr:MAG: hypothetical protein A2743_03455 [Candidatus Taylorbacteria bacterium RIFCSPHIGHO2_01_FULL_43_47]OHA24493.1 MAG: hypothetical protein A3C72_00905 [Candidatus Taylorbacteria bacterium RIFCSPHIGHO2_02_FULL_43_32b]OHA36688.1 MAG: hypothetical protein A3H57_00775 [Candidatus Taylorbacteria bacterium RIFCSPLOWO2_02_FULL_43_11]
MQEQNNKKIRLTIVTIFIVGIIASLFVVILKLNSQNDTAPDNTKTELNLDEYLGKISSNDEVLNVYTNNKFGFTFTYPKEWHVGDNHLGYGTFQLFNYDESNASGSVFAKGWNKIEAGIVSNSDYGSSDEYPEKSRKEIPMEVRGQPSTTTEVTLIGGEKIYSYSILLPSVPDSHLSIAMYGDPLNFYVLDELVQSMTWIK